MYYISYIDNTAIFHTLIIHFLECGKVSYSIVYIIYCLYENFLCNRIQCVRVNNTLSTFLPVGSGIGQGTILGPLLFILYVNDVANQISNSTVKLYADDAKLYGNSANDHQCGHIQNDLNRIEGYLNDWQLTINVGKCVLLHLGYGNLRKDYIVNGEILPKKSICKDLGITISDDFKVLKHCSQICRSSYYKLKQFKLAFSCKDRNFQMDIYKTYVRPLLEYNSQV